MGTPPTVLKIHFFEFLSVIHYSQFLITLYSVNLHVTMRPLTADQRKYPHCSMALCCAGGPQAVLGYIIEAEQRRALLVLELVTSILAPVLP